MAISNPSLIRARGLTKKFGGLTAVDAIDFDVARGESFGFLGPNGAGKTSTMRMIGLTDSNVPMAAWAPLIRPPFFRYSSVSRVR